MPSPTRQGGRSQFSREPMHAAVWETYPVFGVRPSHRNRISRQTGTTPEGWLLLALPYSRRKSDDKPGRASPACAVVHSWENLSSQHARKWTINGEKLDSAPRTVNTLFNTLGTGCASRRTSQPWLLCCHDCRAKAASTPATCLQYGAYQRATFALPLLRRKAGAAGYHFDGICDVGIDGIENWTPSQNGEQQCCFCG